MGEFLIYLGVGAVASWLGWHARGIVILYKLSRDPRATQKLLEELKAINDSEDGNPSVPTDPTTIELKVEANKGLIYLFDKETDRFIGQGPTVADALKMARERFPNKTFWCNKPEQDSQTA
jgi:hypothetical protein